MAGDLIKRNLDTENHTKRTPCKDWSYAVTSQGTTRSQETDLKQTPPQCLQSKYGPVDFHTFGLQNCGTVNFCFLSHSI